MGIPKLPGLFLGELIQLTMLPLAMLVMMDLIMVLWVCDVMMVVDVAQCDFGHVKILLWVLVGGLCSREREGES